MKEAGEGNFEARRRVEVCGENFSAKARVCVPRRRGGGGGVTGGALELEVVRDVTTSTTVQGFSDETPGWGPDGVLAHPTLSLRQDLNCSDLSSHGEYSQADQDCMQQPT